MESVGTQTSVLWLSQACLQLVSFQEPYEACRLAMPLRHIMLPEEDEDSFEGTSCVASVERPR